MVAISVGAFQHNGHTKKLLLLIDNRAIAATTANSIDIAHKLCVGTEEQPGSLNSPGQLCVE